jgi:Uncharacterized conserved small protein
MTTIESFSSVWEAIADTPEQAANLQARTELMRQIAAIIKANDWKQAEAATHCRVTQPRINDLLRGRVSRFSFRCSGEHCHGAWPTCACIVRSRIMRVTGVM